MSQHAPRSAHGCREPRALCYLHAGSVVLLGIGEEWITHGLPHLEVLTVDLADVLAAPRLQAITPGQRAAWARRVETRGADRRRRQRHHVEADVFGLCLDEVAAFPLPDQLGSACSHASVARRPLASSTWSNADHVRSKL